MKKEAEKRPGPGRPSEGKKSYTVTLTAENVARAKKREANFSGLLDRLLAAFLKK
jgi:post-segregation antitoxin (ccd killing protein)